MATDKPQRTLLQPAVLWCVVAMVALFTATRLGFKQVLPPLDAQRVAVALLAAWLSGRLIAARRYL